MSAERTFVAVVDDEESIRKALLRSLRLSDFEATAFSSAMEFLESLQSRRPDCVILDLHMPGMTGVDLLDNLSQLANPPPVIVITADDDSRLREQCAGLGSKLYLNKPIQRCVLLKSVRDVVNASLL